jgi:hypothetical protein
MTTREANAFIKAAHAIGKYVYAPTAETIMTGCMQRVIAAKTMHGELHVKVLATGKWHQLAGNTLETK